jgi:hypothetical protein
MTPQEAIATNKCVAFLTHGEKLTILALAALRRFEANGISGSGAGTISTEAALADASCVTCLSPNEMMTIRTIGALSEMSP